MGLHCGAGAQTVVLIGVSMFRVLSFSWRPIRTRSFRNCVPMFTAKAAHQRRYDFAQSFSKSGPRHTWDPDSSQIFPDSSKGHPINLAGNTTFRVASFGIRLQTPLHCLLHQSVPTLPLSLLSRMWSHDEETDCFDNS